MDIGQACFLIMLKLDPYLPHCQISGPNVNIDEVEKPCARSFPTLGVLFLYMEMCPWKVELPQHL